MSMTTKARMYDRITQHGRHLLEAFPEAVESDPVRLCKRLRRLESAAHSFATALCNQHDLTEDEVDQKTDAILDKVDKLLHFRAAGVPVFVNRDPRGYALKVDDAWMRATCSPLHRDWGGYGILAPEFDGN